MKEIRRILAVIAFTAVMALFVMVVECHAGEYKFMQDWSYDDTLLQAAATGLLIKDYCQTKWMADRNYYWDNEQHREINPILGNRPSSGKVNLYFGTVIIGQGLLALAIPKHYEVFGIDIHPRLLIQGITIGVEAGAIYGNIRISVP